MVYDSLHMTKMEKKTVPQICQIRNTDTTVID